MAEQVLTEGYTAAEYAAKVYQIEKDTDDLVQGGKTTDPEFLTRLIESRQWPPPKPYVFDAMLKDVHDRAFVDEGDLNGAIDAALEIVRILRALRSEQQDRLVRGVEAWVLAESRELD
ncbi:hypothetical protein LTR17_012579 [Elasticomyces elasticus]|nr:hypothetical protein LTR17_012579 [Elasticomyces elasticus]